MFWALTQINPGHIVITKHRFNQEPLSTEPNLVPPACPCSFMNTYTMAIAQLHKQREHEPYEVHMVWGYGGREGKVYNIRDLGLGHDPPEYYTAGGTSYMSFDLLLPEVPEGFNDWGRGELYKEKREVS